MSWIEVLFAYARMLWPWHWIADGEAGVFYKRGKALRLLKPGVYFAFWWFNQIKIENVAIDTLNIPTLSETTTDGIEISYSANFIFRVSDLVKKQTQVRDFSDSLQNLTMIHLARVVRSHDYCWIRDNRERIERAIRKLSRRYAKAWGVEILEVGLTDFVRPQHWRHMGDITLNAN